MVVLQDLAEHYSTASFESVLEQASERDAGSASERGFSERNLSRVGVGSLFLRQNTTKRFSQAGRNELVKMETTRRANLAVKRAKQVWTWTVALILSYVDLVTTVIVGVQYARLGTVRGAQVARITFGMLGASLGLQTMMSIFSGTWAVNVKRK